LRPKLSKTDIHGARWFWGSTTETPRVAYSIHVPCVLVMCPTSPWPRQQHDPLSHASACPNCQPLQLVTRLLQTLDQGHAFVLRHSWPIDTSPHDLHIHHRLSSLCCTLTHHNPRDIIAQHIIHSLVSPHDSTQDATCWQSLITIRTTKNKSTL
jgi:hypothetical protein